MTKKYQYKTKNGKKQRLHRIIMEEKLKRRLESWEHVYHLDGNPENNDIDNLVLIIKNYKNR